jgi:superfamily II helicase
LKYVTKRGGGRHETADPSSPFVSRLPRTASTTLNPASGLPPSSVAITDKIYVKNHRQLASQLDTHLPKSAFAGATLDVLFKGDNLDQLDDATREKVLDFQQDFMDCDCQDNPYCGHPERKFVSYLLELRASGLGPDAIVDAMTADYMVYAYPGDVRSFLDDAVRTLEAVEQLADVDGRPGAASDARQRKRDLL